MRVIPGKYVDNKGREVTVIGIARHGANGENTVIYLADDGGMEVLSEREWVDSHFTSAAELELESYLVSESRAELARRIFELFESRKGVYSVHWRSSFGGQGYNYACENHRSVKNCYWGIDSCKNCREGQLSVFSPEAVDRHLGGEITVGVYPVDRDGCCRFLVMNPKNRAQVDALRRACEENGIPAYCEQGGRQLRLWIFFAEKIKVGYLRRLGNALITLAMDYSSEIGFDMYDNFVPCREEELPEDMGFELTLPFGRTGKGFSVFVDENYEPLPKAAAEIFRIRTVTRSYLADRLNVLGKIGFGRLWERTRSDPELELPPKLEVTLDGTLAIKRAGLPDKTALSLKRLACLKLPEEPFGEFEPISPCISAGFTEDSGHLRLPRGLRRSLEYAARVCRCEIVYENKLEQQENAYFSLSRPVGEEHLRAAKALAENTEGVLLARLGWGKTAAVAKLIELKRSRTLILTADENTRRRWIGNIMDYFGIDAERMGSKIHVRLITDRKLKDKYGLVILADCSRLPMDGEIFARIRDLRPAYIYGITAADNRHDGRWGLIHMLCGPVVFKPESR